MQESNKLNSKVLGQISLMQGVVAQLPDAHSMLNFVCQGLNDIPGVKSVSVVDKNDNGILPKAAPSSNTIKQFPIVGRGNLFAGINIEINDNQKIEPYIPFIENFMSMLGVVLEEANQRNQKEELLNNLEKLVAERTKELEKEIYEKQIAENALKESEVKFREFVEGTDNLIIQIDAQGTFTYVNSAAEQYFEVAPENCIGTLFRNYIDERDRERTDKWFENSVKNRLSNASIENRQVSRTGKVYDMIWTVNFHYNSNFELLYVNSIARDITEIKRHQKALNKRVLALTQPFDNNENIVFDELFDLDEMQKLQDDFSNATGVASVITDIYGKPITQPSNFSRLCRDVIRKTPKGCENCYKSDAELGKFNPTKPNISMCLSGGLWDAGTSIAVEGKHIASWLIGQVRDSAQTEENIRKYAREIGADEEQMADAFYEIPEMPRKQFEQIAEILHTVASQISTMAYQNVQQARFIADKKVAEDNLKTINEEYEAINEELYESLSQIKTINKELENEKLKAQESDRLKSAFLANLSHEIRTPMNGILGFADLLKSPKTNDEKRQKYIKVIQESGQRMLNIINDLIDISKIEAGMLELDMKEISANKLIGSLYSFFKMQADKHNIEFTLTKGLPDNDCYIVADELRTTQVISNLLNNAFKFTNQGKVSFGYTVKNGFLEFFVQDTGIGIPSDLTDIIFKRFRQVDSTISSNYEGTGLGLSISKAFVEKQGGKIWVDSEKDKGSIFYFTVKRIIKEKPDIQEPYKHNNSKELLTDKKLKVLIAEDDDFGFLYLSEVLEEINAEVFRVGNGKEAVDFIDNSTVDIVLIDIKMPVMDGFEATKIIRSKNSDLPIIAQTAFAHHDDEKKAMDVGCDGYIAKPIDQDDLLELIRKVLP